MSNFNIPLILIVFGVFGCSSSKDFNPETYAGSFIQFGSGGGFSGIQSGHVLNDRGEIYHYVLDSIEFVGRIPKNQVKQIESNIEILKIMDHELKDPGNMYKTMTIKNKEGEKVSHVWSMNENPQTENLNLIYSILTNTLKKEND